MTTHASQSMPYSIYVDYRPQRIAFFVNSSKTGSGQIDNIITCNQGKWGGRYNPIFVTNGKSIDDKSWKFLLEYDPDVIKSYVPLALKYLY